MDDIVFVGYGMLWLFTITGLYIGVATLLNQYFSHEYNMRNFPKTYLIKYMILPKSEAELVSSESGNEESDSNADEKSESEESSSDSEESSSDSEESSSDSEESSSDSEDQESESEDQESETQSSQMDYFNSGPEFLRVTFITCSPSDVVKKIKQSIRFDDEKEIFQLIGFEELC